MKPIELIDPDFKAKVEAGICTTCRNKIGEFRDASSVEEYKRSGMCQKCQDSVYDVWF